MTGKQYLHRIHVISAVLFLMTLVFSLTVGGCSSQDTSEKEQRLVRRYIEGDLGLDVRDGILVDCWDNHGGFHGDGQTYIEMHFNDKSLVEVLQQSDAWHSFPLDRDTQILVYGLTENNTRWNPMLNKDGVPEPMVPEIENGYYLLADRQSEEYKAKKRDESEGAGINNRYSYNLTIGIYDADTDTLYVLVLDT